MNRPFPTGGGFWLGRIGSMIQIPDYAATLTETTEDAQYVTLIGGNRIAWVPAGRPRRTWKVSVARLDPHQLGPLQELRAADPTTPWWMVTPWALAVNLLSPAMCDLPALVPGGMRPTVEGDRVVRSWLVGPGAVVRCGPVPVVPGVPVTASAWLQGGTDARVGLEFLDLAGGVVGMRSTRLDPSPGAMERVHVTADVPAGAVSVNLYVTQPTAFSRPSVSWTPRPAEWGVGAGAPAVMVDGLETAMVRARVDPTPGWRLQDISFTVQELRDA